MPDFLERNDEDNTRHNRAKGDTNIKHIDVSKPMSKSELASHLGVSVRTLMRWIIRLGEDKIPGYNKQSKILPPCVIQYLAEKLCF